MKILIINKYLCPRGGDAVHALNTGELLTQKGHTVAYWGMHHPLNSSFPFERYFIQNIDYDVPLPFSQKFKYAKKILYSNESKYNIEKVLSSFTPDIVHLHNIYHQISPSILHVFKKYKIPVVMTLHDYKLVCPAYTLLSKDKSCTQCKQRRFYWCALNRCVKNSFARSALNTIEMYFHHSLLDLYSIVNEFIAPSRFMMTTMRKMGFSNKTTHIHNFVKPEFYEPAYNGRYNTFVYFGRISPEKGIETLINAIRNTPFNLNIVGTGPFENYLKRKTTKENINNVHFLGFKSGNALTKEIKEAMAVIVPSEWYENNPLSILEAFACGKPVIGARIGGIPEIINDTEDGLLFEPGNKNDLQNKIQYVSSNKEISKRMGKNARIKVEKLFNADDYYNKIIEVYGRAFRK
jgi:glycosyltransferase involved in cell wall biosynthesis